MSKKSRGCDYERKLVHILHSKNYAAVRVAGSGSMHYPSPDIIASNGERIIAFEVKSTQNKKVYLKEKDVSDLLIFSKNFKAEPWFAIHLINKGWFFKKAEELLTEEVLRLDETNTDRHF